MTARILQFPKRKTMKQKPIDAELLALMMKHHKLISNARQRGYSDRAISKLVKAAEDSRR